MKKLCFVVAVLVLVLVSTSAFAQKGDKELCLNATGTTPAPGGQGNPVTSQRTIVLSYTGLSNGHVIFYGESCYDIPAVPPNPEVKDCMPVIGSGILDSSKLEFNLQGVEYMTSFGIGVFISGQMHVLLATDTLSGTYAGDSTYYVADQRQELLDTGTIAAVKCPATSKSEADADKQFQKLIDQIDKLGNL
jgi:hypothetical protein